MPRRASPGSPRRRAGELKRDATGVIISADARFSSGGDPIDVSLAGVYARDRSRFSVEANVDGIKPSMFADLSPDAALLRGVDIALSGRLHDRGRWRRRHPHRGHRCHRRQRRGDLAGRLPASHQVKSVNAQAHGGCGDAYGQDRTASTSISAPPRCGSPAPARRRRKARCSPVAPRCCTSRSITWATTGRSNSPRAAGSGRWPISATATIDVAAEFALSTPGNDLAAAQGRSPGRPDRLSRHDGALHAAHARAAGRFGQGALRGRRAAFRRGERHRRRPAHGRRHDRPHRAWTGPVQNAQRSSMPIAGSAQNVIRFLARPQARPPAGDALRLPAAGRRGRDRPVARLPAAQLRSPSPSSTSRPTRSVSKFSLKNVAGRRRPHRRRGADEVRQFRAQRHRHRQARRQPRRDRLARAVRRQGAPSAGATTSRARCRPPSIAKAGFPSAEPYVTGPVGTTLHYQVATNGTGEVVGRFEIKGAKATLAPLGWTKEPGTDGQVHADAEARRRRQARQRSISRATPTACWARARCASPATMSVQQVTLQQFKIGQTDLAVDWKRSGRAASSCRCAARSLELPRVRTHAEGTRRDRGQGPGGRGRHGAQQHQDHPAAPAGPDRARHAGLRQRARWSWQASASPRPTSRSAAARARPSASRRRARAGPCSLYVADFGMMLKRGGLARRAGQRLPAHRRPLSTTARPASPLDRHAQDGPLSPGEGDAATATIGTLNSAIEGLSRAGNAAAAVRRPRGQRHQEGRSHPDQERPHQRPVDRPHRPQGFDRSRQRHGAAGRHRGAGLCAQQPAVERAAARPAADRRQGRRPVRDLLPAARPARRPQDRHQHDVGGDAGRAARTLQRAARSHRCRRAAGARPAGGSRAAHGPMRPERRTFRPRPLPRWGDKP